MVQSGGRPRLLLETSAACGINGEFRWEQVTGSDPTRSSPLLARVGITYPDIGSPDP